jgi:hypothetical protein
MISNMTKLIFPILNAWLRNQTFQFHYNIKIFFELQRQMRHFNMRHPGHYSVEGGLCGIDGFFDVLFCMSQ